MPNVKIYVDTASGSGSVAAVRTALTPMRDMLCRELDVGVTACQLAVLPVHGMDDQPQVNAEILLLPGPERTPERIRQVCTLIRSLLSEVTGLSVAVRTGLLDPDTYIALK